jgi:hypothetical protein
MTLEPIKTILHTIKGGGSGTGLSYYRNMVGCPRRARLDAEAAEEHEATASDNDATGIGTIFHAFMEHYYRGDLDDENLVLEIADESGHGVLEDRRIEAERLFRAHRKRFSRSELGTVLEVEKLLPSPDDAAMAQRINDAVGINPFTCKIDLVLDLTENDCLRLKETRDIEVRPGIWLLDHKTAKARRSTEAEKWTNDFQPIAYQLAWNAAFPKLQAQGMIISSTYRLKQPDFRSFVVERPGAEKVAALQSFLAGAAFIKEHLEDWPNGNACFFPSTCRWFQTGACNRS